MNRNRFDELMESLLESELSPGEIDELEALLSQSTEFRKEACERLAEHRILGFIHREPCSEEAVEAILSEVSIQKSQQIDSILAQTQKRQSIRQFKIYKLGIWAASIAAMFAVVIAWPYLFDSQSNNNNNTVKGSFQPLSTPVATLLLCEACEWEDFPSLSEGHRIPTGPLRLTSGFAVLRFDGGAEVAIKDNVSMELLSKGAARIHFGDAVIRAPEEAVGFTVMTPASELLDLGTEFSVRVDSSGATELDVLEGEVSIRPLDSPTETSKILKAGEAVAVDSARSSLRKIAVKSKRLATLVKDLKPSSRWDLTYAYEGFYYKEGKIALEDSTRGKGWLGPWRARTLKEGYRQGQTVLDSLDIVHGKLNVTWPVPGGRLGMLRMPPGFIVQIRQMKHPIQLAKNATYYLSFMLKAPEPAQHHTFDDFRLTLRSSDDYFGESLSFGVPRNHGPRIQTGLGVGSRGRFSIPKDQSLLCIGKIEAQEYGEDRVQFRIFSEFDELNCIEPRDWDVVCRDLDLSAQLNLVILTSVGHKERIVDELRIGPTWRSVAPILGGNN